MQYTIYLILAPIAGVIALASALTSFKRRTVSGFMSLVWLLIFICGFLFCNILELITATASMTFLWVKLSYLFIPFLPIFWFRFALEYTGYRLMLRMKYFWAVCVIPFITLFCAVYSPLNFLLWEKYTFEAVLNHYMIMRVQEHGIWFWVYAVQGYLLVFGGAALIFRFFFHSKKIFRMQSIWIIIGAILPLVTNFIYLTHIIPGLTKDFSPIGYTFAGICFTIGITHYQLLDLMPMARAMMVEEMRDGVIVLDRNSRVVDINPSARRMLSASKEIGVGSSAESLFETWNKWTKDLILLNLQDNKIEINHTRDNETFWYDLHLSQLRDWRERPNGQLVLINDVTARKRVEETLRQTQEELEQRVIERTAQLAALNATLEQRVSGRTRELSTLYEISKIASQATSIQDLLNQTLNRTMTAIPCQSAAVYLLDELDKSHTDQLNLIVHKGAISNILPMVENIAMDNIIITNIIEQGKPILINKAYPSAIFGAEVQHKMVSNYLVAPMLAESRFWGVMVMANEKGIAFNPNDITLLTSITGQVGLAVQSNYLRQRTILYEERQRLSRDLHDSVTQSLYGLVTLTEAGQALLEKGAVDNISHTFMRIGQTARQALKEMRLYLYELRPPELEDEGLVGAIQMRLTAVEGRSNISTRLIADEQINLPAPMIFALYQITQEALNNILRHTLATSITVRLEKNDQQLLLEITDNGCGFDFEKMGSNGMGLVNMKERARKINGVFNLSSISGQGTCIQVIVPLV